MKRSLLSFIWAFSRRDQLILVGATCLLFPLLYLTLELPKRIINDAISADSTRVEFFGLIHEQKTLLFMLCATFLVSVLVHGILKMRVNTMKGVVAERLLRRFRYTLIAHILRFPRSYQSKTSEGELVSMVTAETEPLGGIMGDAIAQPLLQAGQMLTILLFLFLQSFWFGLAACAMIPLQAWLIPRLQRQINLLNRSRIRQVRALASEIGEVTTGASTLRQNAGWRYRMAQLSQRLSGLFHTRFEIYRRKFFMKFLNNFLNQLTPFMFFLVGGLLVIEGHLTVGALVAALAAFKDLSSPWKELLTYYTASVEMGQRYELVIDRFTPSGLLPDFLSEPGDRVADACGTPGAIELDQVTLMDADGHQVLAGVDLTIRAGSWTCIATEFDSERDAFVQLLLRELAPSAGTVMLDGADARLQSQQSLSGCIGYVSSRPYVFRGTVGENILMPLMVSPKGTLSAADVREARRTGNSVDAVGAEWLPEGGDPELIRAARGQWMPLVAEIGAHKTLLTRVLDRQLDMDRDREVAETLVDIRSAIRAQVRPSGFELPAFDEARYSDGLTLPENLLFAVVRHDTWLSDETTRALDTLLSDLKLRDMALNQSVALAATLIEAFDEDAVESPVFLQLGIPADILPKLHALAKRNNGRLTRAALWDKGDHDLLMSLVLNVPSARFDRAFLPEVKDAILAARDKVPQDKRLSGEFIPLDVGTWHPNLSILDNLIFGKADERSRTRQDEVKAAVTDVLAERIDALTLADLISDLPTDLRGANLTPQMTEVISLSQAAVKSPSIILLDDAMSSYDDKARLAIFAKLREQLPQATIIQIERDPPDSRLYSAELTLGKGQILTAGMSSGVEAVSDAETSELRRKLQAIRKAPLFSGLSGQQLRMLAFSARWVEVPEGTYVFRQNDAPDGAYLIYEGDVSLIARNPDGSENFVVYPLEGTLVGELGLIRNDPRRLDMYADGDTTLLRIDAKDFLSVLENDAQTAYKLIRVLIGYLDR